jgi:hypothetical protein
MSYDKNAFKATGTKPHEAFDFIAYPGDKKTWAPTWGFVTTTKGLDESLEEEVFPRGDWPLFRFWCRKALHAESVRRECGIRHAVCPVCNVWEDADGIRVIA